MAAENKEVDRHKRKNIKRKTDEEKKIAEANNIELMRKSK